MTTVGGLQALESEVAGTPEGCSSVPLLTLPVSITVRAVARECDNSDSSINHILRASY